MEAMMIGMTLLSAVSTVAGGFASMGQARQERQQAETNQALVEVNALNEENDRRDRLMRTLSAQRAQAAAMGIDVYRSGSLTAIQREDTQQAEHEIGLIRLNRLVAVNGYQQQIDNSKAAGPLALGSALLSAAGTIGGGIMRFNSIGGSSTSPKGPMVN